MNADEQINADEERINGTRFEYKKPKPLNRYGRGFFILTQKRILP